MNEIRIKKDGFRVSAWKVFVYNPEFRITLENKIFYIAGDCADEVIKVVEKAGHKVIAIEPICGDGVDVRKEILTPILEVNQ